MPPYRELFIVIPILRSNSHCHAPAAGIPLLKLFATCIFQTRKHRLSQITEFSVLRYLLSHITYSTFYKAHITYITTMWLISNLIKKAVQNTKFTFHY